MIEENNIFIRKAKITDLELMLAWGKKVYEVERQYMPLLIYSAKEAKDRYLNQIDNPLFCFLIAEINGKPVGYLYAHLDQIPYLATKRKECEIEVIYLNEDSRGRGAAGELINACMLWAKNNRAFGIKAGIFADNIASIKAFQKTGFYLKHSTYCQNL